MVEAARNVVSHIHSLYAGNGVVAGDTGILLNNGMGVLQPGPGSFWQVQTNLQLISSLIDLGMPLQGAIDAPRWTMGGQTSWSDSSLNLEAHFGDTVVRHQQRHRLLMHHMGKCLSLRRADAINRR